MVLLARRSALAAIATSLLSGCAAAPERRGAQPSIRRPPSLGAPIETLPVDEPRPGELHVLYDLPDAPDLWSPVTGDEAQEAYRARLAARLPGSLSPRDLLERQRAVMAAIGTENARGDAENGALLLEGRAGTIGPASWLEWLLFREQDRRYPMIEHPSEMGAYVLRGKGRARVYLSSMESVGGKLRREISDRVAADAAAGFEVTAHLHNHPFMFDRVPGDRMWTTPETVKDVGGALAPSTNDVAFYRGAVESVALRGAWVTNGLDTARFTAADLERLKAAPPR